MLKTFTRLVWTSLVLLCFLNDSYGQKNFVPGYLILPSHDTLSGLIDDQNWDRNPTAVTFKESKEAETQRYTAAQIAGFGMIKGDTYRQSIVQIDKTPVRFEELITDSRPVLVVDTVFLLELVRGEVNLYHLNDENHKNHFFIQKEDGPLTELIQRNYVAYKNNQPLFGTADQYKDQLKYSYVTECLDLSSQIVKTAYTKAALSSLIKKYNACLHPETPATIKVDSKHESKFGLVAGANVTTYRFKGSAYDYLTITQFNWQKNPMLGLSYQLVLPRNRQKWSIYNELAWKKNYTQGRYNEESFYKVLGTVTIKASYIGLTSMLRYAWMNQNWQPFINAGLAGNVAYKINTHVQHREQYSTFEKTTDRDILQRPGKFEAAAVMGAGIKVKKMTAEIRLERGNGYLNPYREISVRKTMLAFLLSYQIN